MYAETDQERHVWIKRIKANLNRLSNCSHYCSPDFCSLDSHHHGHQALMSVLDRWLNKLDLYDGSDDDSDYFPKQPSTNSSSPNHRRSNSSVGGHSSSSFSTPKHKSTESISTLDYSSSMYSESSIMTPSSNTSSFNSGHHCNHTRRQHATPIKHHYPARQDASPAGHGGSNTNTHQSPAALSSNTTYFSQLAPSHQIKKLLSIESERLKYAETTLQYYQHPHIHRSTSTKLRSELGISLSPPPPKR